MWGSMRWFDENAKEVRTHRGARPLSPCVAGQIEYPQDAPGCPVCQGPCADECHSSDCEVLGVTDAQVAGVLSYYSDLRTQSVGRHLIRVCLGESCMANHGGRVLRAIQDHVGVAVGDTSPEGRFTVEQMSCAGNCAVSPTVMIDEELRGRVTPSDVPSLLEPYR